MTRWSLVILPTTIGLAFILSTGPQAQTYLLSLLNSDLPTIYGSAYRENLIVFPRLSTWVAAGFEWHFLLMSLLITCAVTQRSEPRLVIWRASVASFLVLCIFDVGFGLFWAQMSVKWIAENATGNLFGAIVFALLTVTTFSVADFLFDHVPLGSAGKRIAAACSVMLGGLVSCCSVYYLADLLYNPLPVKLAAYFAAPVSGIVAPKPANLASSSKGTGAASTFSFLPERAITSNLAWTSVEGALTVTGPTKGADQIRHVRISLFSGCSNPADLKSLNDVSPWIAVDSAHALEVSFDSGFAEFFTMFSEMQRASFKVTHSPLNEYRIDQDGASNHIKVTQFFGGNVSLDIDSSGDEQSYFLVAPTIRLIKGQTSLSSRVLTVKVGSRTRLFKFDPPRAVSGNEKIVCSQRKNTLSQEAVGADFVDVGPVDGVAGVQVTILRRREAILASNLDGGMHVSGSGGWLRFGGLQPDQLDHHSLGPLTMFQFRGNISELVLDGTPTVPRAFETYTAMGDMTAEFGGQGKVILAGQANNLWKNQSRMNPTKWEKLGWEAKSILLGLMGAALAGLWPLLVQRLQQNRRFAWME